jgi:hypothetical protein
MICHSYLRQFNHPRAKSFIKKKAFIGIYVATGVEWVSVLKNKPWITEAQEEEFFQWRLNIASFRSFLETLKSCLIEYVPDLLERTSKEESICRDLSDVIMETSLFSIEDLQKALERMEYSQLQYIERKRAIGTEDAPPALPFYVELFSPLKVAISIASKSLNLEAATWLLCIDEAEFLKPLHHRILNTFLRSALGNLKFKITTTPYHHLTLSTNASDDVAVHHDFEYVYIDHDPVVRLRGDDSDEPGYEFAENMFQVRAESSGKPFKKYGVTLRKLLGPSPLLDSTHGAPSSEEFWRLLEKHADSQTLQRAERLVSQPDRYGNEIVRKMRSALILREHVMEIEGHGALTIYSGARLAVRCSDLNPRRLVRLMAEFVRVARIGRIMGEQFPVIPAADQTRIMLSFSGATLNRVRSEADIGQDLHSFLSTIGNHFNTWFYRRKLSSNQVGGIRLSDSSTPVVWNLVKEAVGLGLLYPAVNTNLPDEMPEGTGVFRLAYVLAPHFKILPRRGRVHTIQDRIYRPDTDSRSTIFQIPLPEFLTDFQEDPHAPF